MLFGKKILVNRFPDWFILDRRPKDGFDCHTLGWIGETALRCRHNLNPVGLCARRPYKFPTQDLRYSLVLLQSFFP